MLPSPARYFPLEKGIYEVGPGLASLSQPKGNGPRDGQVFQIDSEFQKYRDNKLLCRQENLNKYYLTANYAASVSAAVNRFIVQRLTIEHPEHFFWKPSRNGGSLACSLTSEEIELNDQYELSRRSPYISAFDALCNQVQEDVAVVTTSPEGQDWLSAIHLCSPSHWAAAEKIGKNFFEIHKPVAGIEKVNAAARSLIDAMIYKGPYVRFVWGFGTDDRLNHHPLPPPGYPEEEWRGRTFQLSANGSPFILRVERQVLWGLPEVSSAVFMIRLYFLDGEEIRRNPKERALLRSGLLSMSPESRVYKGLSGSMDQIIAWLDGHRPDLRRRD